MRRKLALLGTLALCVTPSLVAAYQVNPPRWPGSIKGTVKVLGEFTPGAPVAIERDTLSCGKEIPDDSLLVGNDGRLQNAIVFLESIPAGKDFPRRQVQVDVRDCRLGNRVFSLGTADDLSLSSVDSVFHQLRVEQRPAEGQGDAQVSNLGLPPGSQRVRLKTDQPGWVRIQGVGAHPWINGVGRVFDHPYHAVTEADGTFNLQGVPGGKYVLHVWHERLGELSKPVEVVAGYPVRVELQFGAAPAPATP